MMDARGRGIDEDRHAVRFQIPHRKCDVAVRAESREIDAIRQMRRVEVADVDGSGHVPRPRQAAGEEVDGRVMAPDEQAFVCPGIARQPTGKRAGAGLLVGVPARDAAPEGVDDEDQRRKRTG